MPRKKTASLKRKVAPDPKFNDVLVSRTINVLMRRGKRGIAERCLYQALEKVQEKLSADPVESFKKAIGNIRPLVEVRSRRVGGATYQVPTEVAVDRGESLAIRWLVSCANSRSERVLAERIAGEILDASAGRGLAMKKREDTHKMAEANKAFAHFKW